MQSLLIVSTGAAEGGKPPPEGDPALSDGGAEAAKAAAALAAELHKTARFTALYSSPYMSCLQTAAVVSGEIGLPVRAESGFAEVLCRPEKWHPADPGPNPLEAVALFREPAAVHSKLASSLQLSYLPAAAPPRWPECPALPTPHDTDARAPLLHRYRRAVESVLSEGSLVVVGHDSAHDLVTAAVCGDSCMPPELRVPHLPQPGSVTLLSRASADEQWCVVMLAEPPVPPPGQPIAWRGKAAAPEAPADLPPEVCGRMRDLLGELSKTATRLESCTAVVAEIDDLAPGIQLCRSEIELLADCQRRLNSVAKDHKRPKPYLKGLCAEVGSPVLFRRVAAGLWVQPDALSQRCHRWVEAVGAAGRTDGAETVLRDDDRGVTVVLTEAECKYRRDPAAGRGLDENPAAVSPGRRRSRPIVDVAVPTGSLLHWERCALGGFVQAADEAA